MASNACVLSVHYAVHSAYCLMTAHNVLCAVSDKAYALPNEITVDCWDRFSDGLLGGSWPVWARNQRHDRALQQKPALEPALVRLQPGLSKSAQNCRAASRDSEIRQNERCGHVPHCQRFDDSACSSHMQKNSPVVAVVVLPQCRGHDDYRM